MARKNDRIAPSICVLLAAFANSASFAAPEFIDPGALPSALGATATCASGDGSIVGGLSAFPFRWSSSTGMVRLSIFAGVQGSSLSDMSDDGTICVGTMFTQQLGSVPVRWNSLGEYQRLDLPAPAFAYGYANGVSADGQTVVGTYWPSSQPLAYRWTQSSGMQFIGVLPGETQSFARAISGDGTVVGGSSGNAAYVWTSAAGMTDLGTYSGRPSAGVSALSFDGRVAVGTAGSTNGTAIALMWRDGQLQPPLVTLTGATTSYGSGVNRDGSVAVGWYEVDGTSRAFVWTAGQGSIDLTAYALSVGVDLQGNVLQKAWSISSDGSTIVGWYIRPTGQGAAFILRDLPLGDNRCPACAADFDEDGGVTGGDLAAFMTAYEAGARCADVDDDDQIDAKDVAAFLGRFEHGGCE